MLYNLKEREQLSRLYEEDIAVLRDVAVTDEKIKGAACPSTRSNPYIRSEPS